MVNIDQYLAIQVELFLKAMRMGKRMMTLHLGKCHHFRVGSTLEKSRSHVTKKMLLDKALQCAKMQLQKGSLGQVGDCL